MNKLREIPAETLKTWAKYFEDGILQDEYGPELANLLNLLAADVEFHKHT